jgi:hypothetical protein
MGDMFAGYFQSQKGQFGCISCDSLGDFYQELRGQNLCVPCPDTTKRYIGVLSAATRSSCQCKEGKRLLPLSVGCGASRHRTVAFAAASFRRAERMCAWLHLLREMISGVSALAGYWQLPSGECENCPLGALCRGRLHRPAPLPGTIPLIAIVRFYMRSKQLSCRLHFRSHEDQAGQKRNGGYNHRVPCFGRVHRRGWSLPMFSGLRRLQVGSCDVDCSFGIP